MRKNIILKSMNEAVASKRVETRRYSLSEMISESYKALYDCEEGSMLHKLAEAHLEDVRKNPTEIERLSRQLSNFKEVKKLHESGDITDKDLEAATDSTYEGDIEKEHEEDREKRLEATEKVEEGNKETEEEEFIEESIEEDTELTDEEVAELAKHLTEIRKNKTVNEECKSGKKIIEGRKLKKKVVESTDRELDKKVTESKSYEGINLSEFSKKSAGKAFMKTFKKLGDKLQEGTALTRQESIALYKAANSAMTHLSVELEHNPDFLPTFNESVSLLAVDVNSLLESMKNDKAPSKATMKSLAKFSEALLYEEDEIENEEEALISEEEEKFDQEYADARVELHKELVDEHEDDENPAVEEKLAQDAEEILDLPGVTDEQAAELAEELTGDEVESTEEEIPVEEPTEDAVEEAPEEDELEEVKDTDSEVTEDELAELKRYLKEMRESKSQA